MNYDGTKQRTFPKRHTITSIHQKFLETDLVEDCIRSGRLSTITDDIMNEIE